MKTLRTNQDLRVRNGVLTLPTSARTKEAGRETWQPAVGGEVSRILTEEMV